MEIFCEENQSALSDKINFARRVLEPYFHFRNKPTPKPIQYNKYFLKYLQKKPHVLLQLLEKWCLTHELLAIVENTARNIREYTHSDGCIVYLVETDTNEIFQISNVNLNSHCTRISYKLEDSNVAAYVAKTKQIVKIDDLLEDPRFPIGLGFSELTVKAVICVPILTPDDECLVVVEIHREFGKDVYSDNDLLLVIIMSSWMGASIYFNQQQLNIQKQEELSNFLLHLTECYFSDVIIKGKLIREFINLTKNVLCAERCIIYVLRTLDENIFLDSYEDNKESNSVVYKKKEYKLTNDTSDMLNMCIQEGQIINVKQSNIDGVTKMFDKKAFKLKSLLCYPIKCVGKILGSMVIINKRNTYGFVKNDEMLLKIFTDYCGLVLEYAKTYDTVKDNDSLNNVYRGMIIRLMHPCIHDINDSNWSRAIPQHFNTFEFYITENEQDFIPRMIKYILQQLACDLFPHSEALKNFILVIKNSYRNNKYHNIMHGFHSCHCVYIIINNCSKVFSLIERTAMLIAAFCHGIDHRGYTNIFLERSQHYLASLYDIPITENHSYFMISLLLSGTKIFHHLSVQKYKQLLNEIKFCVCATDLATHLKNRDILKQIIDDRLFCISSPSHNKLFKSIIMSMADFADFCKIFSVTHKSVINLYDEYYKEARVVGRKALCPILYFDRNNENSYVTNHIKVMEFIVVPCAQILHRILPTCIDILNEANKVTNMWKGIPEEKNTKFWNPDFYNQEERKRKNQKLKLVN